MSVAFSPSRLGAVCRAEYLKIWASKIPALILLAVPIVSYLFVFEVYHVERLNDGLKTVSVLAALPVLAFAMLKTLLFQASMIGFSAFWATVDSQYGMVRVGTCQPVTRVELQLGKWMAVSGHVALLTAAFAATQIAWACAYSGVRGVDAPGVRSLALYTLELVCLVTSISAFTMAAASLRRTVGSGIVVAFLAFLALALLQMLPFRVLSPRFVLIRYFFFPLGELPNPFPGAADTVFVRARTLGDFFLVTTLTPLLVAVPALAAFRRRDIVE